MDFQRIEYRWFSRRWVPIDKTVFRQWFDPVIGATYDTKQIIMENTRRKLKMILKDAQRNGFCLDSLLSLGLYASNLGELSRALYLWKARGHHFGRLGKAALKKGCVCSVLEIALAVQYGVDLREIPFYKHNRVIVDDD